MNSEERTPPRVERNPLSIDRTSSLRPCESDISYPIDARCRLSSSFGDSFPGVSNHQLSLLQIKRHFKSLSNKEEIISRAVYKWRPLAV